MALTKAKKTVRSAGGGLLNAAVAAGAVCFQGGLAILASGNARAGRVGQGADAAAQAADAATYRAAGVFQQSVTGGAANGDVRVDIQEGRWLFKNGAGGDALTIADRGRRCFVIDDETVGKTNPNNTRAVAGVVIDVDATGIMVDIGLTVSAALSAA